MARLDQMNFCLARRSWLLLLLLLRYCYCYCYRYCYCYCYCYRYCYCYCYCSCSCSCSVPLRSAPGSARVRERGLDDKRPNGTSLPKGTLRIVFHRRVSRRRGES